LALDNLVAQIEGEGKNINAVQKSKLDWEKYAKENKIEADLAKNRKDGYLAKRNFLEKVEEAEYQRKKQIERQKPAK